MLAVLPGTALPSPKWERRSGSRAGVSCRCQWRRSLESKPATSASITAWILAGSPRLLPVLLSNKPETVRRSPDTDFIGRLIPAAITARFALCYRGPHPAVAAARGSELFKFIWSPLS